MKIKNKLRFKVLNRDEFTCQYCGRKAPDVPLHVDHVVPRSKEGKTVIDNLKTACSDCNLGKGNMYLKNQPLTDFERRKIERDKIEGEKTLKIIRKMEAERLLKIKQQKSKK